MGYSGSVDCRCVARGIAPVPAALAEVVQVADSGRVRGPSRRSPRWGDFESWRASACDHPGFEAADHALGNNRMVGLLERAVEAVCDGDPAISALLAALPRHHGSTTTPEQARAARPGASLVRDRLSRLTVSGLEADGDGLLFWDLGTAMRLWLSGGEEPLTATVADGVIGILINDELRIRARTLSITPLSEDSDAARFTDPATGTTAIARWPYRSRSLRGYTGPVPAGSYLVTMLAVVEALIAASIEQDMPIWWG